MKVAVIGTGGVGGYFGGRLAHNGEDVWFLARGKHLQAIKSHGLRVDSVDGNFVVPAEKFTDNPAAIGSADVVLFCVKSYDTDSAGRHLAPMLHDRTIIISLQNGVDNEKKLRRAIPRGVVFGGVSYIYSTITAPGIITHTVGPTKILFGQLKDGQQRRGEEAEAILNMMVRAGINAALVDDVETEIWKKFVFISSVGGMTALTRLTLGEILAVPETSRMLADAMRETDAVGRAKGINLPSGFVEQVFEILKKYDNNSRSSMYHDLTHARPMEIEAFSGIILRYGKELGLPTPVHQAIYACLLPYHLKHSRKNP